MMYLGAESENSFMSHVASDPQKLACTDAKNLSYSPREVEAASSKAGLWARRYEKGTTAQVLYDSFTQAHAAGMRSAGMNVRQMLYRTEHYQIDIQIQIQPDGNRLVIVGQLLDTRRPGIVDVGVQVTLSDGRGNMVHTTTNQFGEFRGEVGNSGDLELSFLGRDGKSIIILLRAVLDPMAAANN